MKFRTMLATTLLLAGCASSGSNNGLVRRDGSWYSPAKDGHGDYYTGDDHRYLGAEPWAWSVGFAPYDGYCSVVYRYCSSFWGYSPWAPHGGYSPWAWAWVPPTHYRRPLRERDSFRSVFEDHDGLPDIGEPPAGTPVGNGNTGGAGSRRPEGGWGGGHREGRSPPTRRRGNGGAD